VKKREFIHIDDLSVDLEARQVRRDEQEVELGRLSFDLLAALIRAAPAALSNDDIVQEVWSGDIVSDETVKQRVSLLRRGLGQGTGREYVETLRGFGYRLGMDIEVIDDTGGEVTPAGKPVLGRIPRAIILFLVIVSLILLVAILATAARQVKRLSDVESDPIVQTAERFR
jgi:DNA-binding winged helix-turn-helix (wHTH) protein